MIIHNMEQRSPEWFAIRQLKLTASHAQEIGNIGKGLDTYIRKIMGDYITNNKDERYTNANMERGKALEDEAISIYELETGNIVTKVGFCEHTEHSGCSPDGLIGNDGGIEVKCHDGATFADLILDGEIDSKYDWQINMNLLITGRKWFDYVGYNPNVKRSLFIKRILPNPEKQEKLRRGIESGSLKIKEKLVAINRFIGA